MTYPKRTDKDDYYISTIDKTGQGGPFGKMEIFQPEEEFETAVVHDGHYYILNGDHHEKYKKLSSLDMCRNYFNLNIDQKSGWSEDWK